MRRLFFCLAILALTSLLIWSSLTMSSLLRQRPVAVKLGYVPSVSIFKLLPREHHATLAALLNLKVLFYFGGLVESWQNQIKLPPEYDDMYRTIVTATRLDPYNADPYYFTQAIFTWDAGQYEEVNRLLTYGMDYRQWDPMLPFFAGFNAGYFLKAFDQASLYMARAAEISGNPAMARLASRYYYEAGDLDLAIQFLQQMESLARSQQEAELYRMRREALQAVKILSLAVDDFWQRRGTLPSTLETLVNEGLLTEFPIDPYGGQFYLDAEGRVRSTSNLATKPSPPPKEGN